MKNSLKSIFRLLHQNRSNDFNQIGEKIAEKFGQKIGFGY